MRILIVDDNRGTLNALRIGLTSFGHHVTAVSSGVQALRIITETMHAEKRPDLLLTDLKMPMMNGIQLIRSARSVNAKLPVILMTGYGGETVRRETRGMDRFAYLEKPFQPEDLANVIDRLIVSETMNRSAADRESTGDMKTSQERWQMQTATGKRILIIDDDAATRNLLKEFLETAHYECDTADTGEYGLSLFQERFYHLLFLDLNLPKMNGVEVLREIRKHGSYIPVYIITSFFGEYFEQLITGSEKGMKFELLQKPLSQETVLDVVKSTLGVTTSA